MKINTLYIFILLSIALPLPASGQLSNWGANEFAISNGLFSYDQLVGLFADNTKAKPITSFPGKVTGALFLSYRHYFNKKLAVGVCAGVDNQQGDLSYGPDGYWTFGPYGTYSGYYKRTAYTGAVEVKSDYVRKSGFVFYGYLGVGYTSSRVSINFYNDIPSQSYFYGTQSSLFLHQSTTFDLSHFTGQITPAGVRYGRSIYSFLELGVGYKGILSAGLSYTFNKSTHKVPVTKFDPAGEVFVVPRNYPTDDLEFRGSVATGKKSKDEHCSFDDQINSIDSDVSAQRGDVFRVMKIKNPFGNCIQMYGRAYKTYNVDSFKKQFAERERRRFKNGTRAFVTIYRTSYNYSRYRSHRHGEGLIDVAVGDSTSFDLKVGKHVHKITKEGNCKITLPGSGETVNIEVKFGNDYYVEAYNDYEVSKKGCPINHLRVVGNTQGKLECSFIDGKRIKKSIFK